MNRNHRNRIGCLGLGATLGLAISALNGCDNDTARAVAEQCGLDVDCTAGGFAEGNASISGVAFIDSFFGAAIDLEASMSGLSGELRAELDAIGASVGLAPGASGAELSAALQAHVGGFIDGSFEVTFQPAQCQASVEASVAAAAQCDAEVNAGEVSATCEGRCEIEAGAEVSCEGEATLMCSGTAPSFDCTGTCSGECVASLTASASCEGTCRGSCTVDGNTQEGFDGVCNGMCEGECAVDMSAGGSCDFQCQGNCDYVAPEAGCEAGASASCEASASGSVECEGSCEGTVVPPSVSAECEATVDAKASASVECTPPTLAFEYEWAAGVSGDATAQAEFRAWLENFRIHFGAILAARAKADIVVDSALGLITSADLEGGVLLEQVEEIAVSGNIQAAFGARCAVDEVTVAFDALNAAQASLRTEVEASVAVIGAF
ncbi:MAG: hypothetical protein AAF799_39870 [Myxococcota bacterium]